MRTPTYGAVTGITVFLAGVCALRVAFFPLIPPPPHPHWPKGDHGDYVTDGMAQEIDWRPPTAKTFAEAQRLSRPVLVVVGLPWSGVARQADEALSRPEVVRALNRGFIAVRIDASKDPRWLSQFLPLQRTNTAFGVGFQAWTFDLKWRLVDFMARLNAQEDLRHASLLDPLLGAQRNFAEAVLSDETPSLELSQEADRRRLLQPAVPSLILTTAASTLESAMDPEFGGWGEHGFLVSRPWAFRFLQLTGEWDASGASLRRLLVSPRADWLDGGFYRLAVRDSSTPEYDKTAVGNATFAEVLAVQDAARPDPALRRAARRTIAWLLGLRQDDLVPGAEMGDEDEQGRSARASFSPGRLREAVAKGDLSAADRDWATKTLRLNANARLVQPTWEAIGTPRLGAVLNGLRRSAGAPRRRVAVGRCDVNGTVAACLLRCARLWNDRDLAIAAGAMVDRMAAFQPTPLPRHDLTDPSTARPYLGDALAYADAQMEDFLTNGRVPSLERGTATLRAALKTFGGPEPGVLRPSPAGTDLLPGMGEVPQVVDDEGEALSARALRLVRAYAAVLGPGEKEFAQAAVEIEANLGAVVDALPAMGGALGAIARYVDPRCAFVVGPEALTQSGRLARRLPNRLIVPVGPSRPDLMGRRPGIYIQERDGIAGPFSEDEAAARLPNAHQL